jgi:hypothetical protein
MRSAEPKRLMALHLLEEQGGAGRLRDAVRDRGDLEVAVDLGGDALQDALFVEEGDEFAEVLEGHGASCAIPKPE